MVKKIGDDGNNTLVGTSDPDVLLGLEGDDKIFGREGDDKIHGNEGDDKLYGNEGDDTLYGDDGDDILAGNEGNDILAGGAGDDRLFGHDGDDKLFGHDGDDKLNGHDGDDKLNGHAGNDVLSGGAGDDGVSGGDGDDSLFGGDGDDTLSGGDGDDHIVAAEGDTVDGGADTDTLELNLTAAEFAAAQSDLEDFQAILDGAGNTAPHTIAALSMSVNSIEVMEVYVDGVFTTIDGTNTAPVAVDDVLVATEDTAVVGDVSLNDSDADGDTLTFSGPIGGVSANGGTVVMNALGGYTYTPAADFNGADSFTYFVSDGNGGFDSATVNITVNPTPDGLHITSSSVFTADENGTAIDSVVAVNPDDTSTPIVYSLVIANPDGTTRFGVDMDVVGGNVTIDSGTGALTFVAAPNFENPMDNGQPFTGIGAINNVFVVTVQAAQGGNVVWQEVNILLTDVNEAPVIGNNAGLPVDNNNVVENVAYSLDLMVTDVDAGDTQSYALSGPDAALFSISPAGILSLAAQDFEDPLDADVNNVYTVTVTVTDSGGLTDVQTINLTINDVVPITDNGLFTPGNDGPQNLTSEDDVVNGLGGDDTINGLGGDDVIDGSSGEDLLRGGGGDDHLDGGTDNDTLRGQDGDDTLIGGDGDDRLIGGDGDDSMAGDAGNDTLFGGSGDDTLIAGSGNDVIDGGTGADTMQSSFNDADSFVFDLADLTDGAIDTIVGFDGDDANASTPDDMLNLDDILDGNANDTNIDSYVHITDNGDGTQTLFIDSDGAFNGANFVAVANFTNSASMSAGNEVSIDLNGNNSWDGIGMDASVTVVV